MRHRLLSLPWLLVLLAAAATAAPGDVLYATEGNNLWRIDLAAPDRAAILIHRAGEGEGASPGRAEDDGRRDINGIVCRIPGSGGRFVAGEDTGQPATQPGWGVFTEDGKQIGKLATSYRVEQGEPYGCAFDAQGRLFTSDVGNQGFGASLGQLTLWFPPFDHFPGRPGDYPRTGALSENFCRLADDIGTAGAVAIDSQGRIYIASAGRGAIYRFSPPFPTGPRTEDGCGARDSEGAPMADVVQRETFYRGIYTFSGIAFAPGGNLYAASVFTGEIIEISPAGELVRHVLEPDGWLPPFASGNPMGIAVDSAGTLYYADLDLSWEFPSIGPGSNGKIRRIRFGPGGEPEPPEILLDGLAFPDGVSVHPLLADERAVRAAPR